MSSAYVIMTGGKITTYFGGPQDESVHPGIEEISLSSDEYKSYYASLDDMERQSMPDPE